MPVLFKRMLQNVIILSRSFLDRQDYEVMMSENECKDRFSFEKGGNLGPGFH